MVPPDAAMSTRAKILQGLPIAEHVAATGPHDMVAPKPSMLASHPDVFL